MHVNRRLSYSPTWATLVLTLSLSVLGLILLYSTSSAHNGITTNITIKQLLWLAVGLTTMRLLLCIDYQRISHYAYWFYGLIVISLGAVLISGQVINGAQRWLALGPWRWQPSELAKPILILVLAQYCAQGHSSRGSALGLGQLLLPIALVGLPFILIAKQPDLSTSMILAIILLVMLFVNGVQRRTLWFLISLGICALPAMWMVLKDYQRSRLLTLFNPQDDLLGAGYHSWQSKIAIGSGGIWGKGLFAGTQSRLRFLPETHTDFIAAVLGEELGFIGMCLILTLFSILIVYGCIIAAKARDRLGTLIATGVITMIAAQVVLNIGMITGMVPIIGLPLPLISYGGSSLISTLICLGLLMNVQRQRFTL